MAGSLQDTPGGSRLHIGVFGRTNSGKSSFINAFAGHEVSIVADVAGTTTDPVSKSMEIAPLGACVLTDTAGFDDASRLGTQRLEKTRQAAEKTELAVLLFPADVFARQTDPMCDPGVSGKVEDGAVAGSDDREADAAAKADGREVVGETGSTAGLDGMQGPDEREKAVGRAAVERCFAEELRWYRQFKKQGIPVLPVLSKADCLMRSGCRTTGAAETAEPEECRTTGGTETAEPEECAQCQGAGTAEPEECRQIVGIEAAEADEAGLLTSALQAIRSLTGTEPLAVSAAAGMGIHRVREALARLLPEDYDSRSITGELCGPDDVVLLVMPQDIQAPKGRLILPQVQTIRELLDKKCIVLSVTTDRLPGALSALSAPPKLIITDSQVFGEVYRLKPAESMLTSFSVLFAAYKGDLPYYIEGAAAIDSLTSDSHVLIAECCTHAPLTEDIGRVKIPRMLKKRFGEGITVDLVSGTDFPEDLTGYDLIIQCGACMFNRRYVIARVDRAKRQGVPMTNYGVTIAHLTGILDKISYVKEC